MSRESFPELPQMPAKIAELPVKILASMIARTQFAISTEESRFTLNGALLVVKPGSSDHGGDRRTPSGLRANQGRETGQVDQFPCADPQESHGGIGQAGGHCADGENAKANFSGDDNHLFFEVGQRLLITRKLTGNFPDFERALPKDHNSGGHSSSRTRSVQR
jgi:DNA polymerase-3 subunit beta